MPHKPEDMVKLFDLMDTDANGKLTINELKKGVKQNFSPNITDRELAAMFVGFDEDGDKCISKAEFLDQMCSKIERKVAFKQAFDQLDTDKSGSLSLEEVKPLFKKSKCSDADIKKIFDGADVDHSGKVSCEEFLRLM